MKSRDSHAQSILVRLQSAECKEIEEKVQGSYILHVGLWSAS